MAFEERSGNHYYYRKRRDGNRVISEYVGKGELAFLIAQMDEIERQEKETKAAKQRNNRDTLQEIDQQLSGFEEKTKSLLEAVLIEKGFYRTKSREWRIKNGSNN
jgi:hypothetical protein